MKSRIEKLYEIKTSKALDAFLITSPVSIKYLCGYFYNFEIGPSPFQLIPAALFVVPTHGNYLVIADNETDQLADIDPDITVNQYASYTYEKPLAYSTDFLVKLLEVLQLTGNGKVRMGIESHALPYFIAENISLHNPNIEFTDISSDLAHLRMIKDSDELSFIRAATHLCDVGQEAVIKYANPGISELELFTLVRGDMDAAAGKRVPMMADLVCGSRTADGGGNPSGKKIQKGDMIMSDLTPCLNGYWGDTCNTYAMGKPRPKQRELFLKIMETLELGISAIKPGIPAAEIDQLMRKHLAPEGGYGHHSGHGVGLAYHEEPRIVPYNRTELMPNMVIALEPGIYSSGYGIRLEHLVVVTLTGCEVISRFNHTFE
jgi:Xaa-Pro dipeptidase